MPAKPGYRHDDRDAVCRGESSGIATDALDPTGVFFDIWGIFGRRRTARIDDRRAGEHDHVAALTIAIKIKRDAGVAIDISNFLIVLTVDLNLVSTVPEKPNQAWLRDAVSAYRCQPTDNLFRQSIGNSCLECIGWIEFKHQNGSFGTHHG